MLALSQPQRIAGTSSVATRLRSCLAPIQQPVGTIQDRGGSIAAPDLGGPHGDGDADSLPGERGGRCRHQAAQALGDPRPPFLADTAEQNHEFLSSPTAYKIEGTQVLRQGLRHRAEHSVARGVPVLVVDSLEEIDVGDQ